MNILIYDTETTGFPFKNLPANDPKQARVLQLAALLIDEEFNEVDSLYELIKLPEGKIIDEGAFKAHGKTWEMCNEKGINIESAYTKFSGMMFSVSHAVCHNVNFDKQLINIEGNRLNLAVQFINDIPHICTMELMTPICKLSHATRRNFGSVYKWPKLKEAYKFCFGEEPSNQHDALGDVRATAKIFRWLVEHKYITLPSKKDTSTTLA